jgi:hypothetical protein
MDIFHLTKSSNQSWFNLPIQNYNPSQESFKFRDNLKSKDRFHNNNHNHLSNLKFNLKVYRPIHTHFLKSQLLLWMHRLIKYLKNASECLLTCFLKMLLISIALTAKSISQIMYLWIMAFLFVKTALKIIEFSLELDLQR